MEKIGNTHLENRIFSSRFTIAIGFILALTLLVVLRIYNLQITQNEHYLQEALGNQMRDVAIVPTRGKILDRNGQLLATNELSYKLTLTPEKVPDIEKTLSLLMQSGFIEQKDIADFHKNRKRYKKFHSIPIKHKLDEQQVAKFLVSNEYIGVDIQPYFHRIYPQQESSVHVIGYVSHMNKKDKQTYNDKNYLGTTFVGKTGIEKQYEGLLHGTTGTQQIERNVSGRIIDTKVVQPSTPGNNLYLSIDLDMQKKAESLLASKRGSIVVVDVTNGEVLTLVSSPTYNPNWFVGGISQKNYQSLQTSKDIPFLNRSVQGFYPPGSTVKPMVALAGLESGTITKKSKTFCPGHFRLPNVKRKFNDWKRTGHGEVDVEESIAQSCDVFFYELADNMGIDLIHDNLKYFNFGQKTGIDIPGEGAGVLPSRAWKKINKKQPWYRGETLITGIGQGFMTSSPLQLAVATAALANKGQLYPPKLLKSIQSADGVINNTKTPSPQQIPIKNIDHWETVLEGMEKTVYGNQGTARRINKNLNYTMAGKTGTAQVFGLDPEEEYIAEKYEEHLRDHALFTAFAPIKDPKIAIAVIVENAGSGSIKAAPLAKEVLDVYFNKQQVN